MSVSPSRMNEELQDDLALQLTQRSSSKKYSFWHLCYSWRLTRYTVAMSFMWLITSCVSYGMLFNIGNLAGDVYINMTLYGLCRYTAQCAFALLGVSVKSIGRKTLLLAAIFIMLLSGLGIIFLQTSINPEWAYYHTALRSFNIVMAAFTSPCWILVTLLSAELYPTPIRNIANGTFSMFARIGGAMAPQLLSMNDLYMPYAAYIAFVSLLVVEVFFVIFGLDETKNNPMPEHMPDKTQRIGYKNKDREMTLLPKDGR